ncbi:MAG TPA: hypothetical protein ACFYEK_11720 [Candidatus Wunengus sp. YC60]
MEDEEKAKLINQALDKPVSAFMRQIKVLRTNIHKKPLIRLLAI